MMFSVIYFIIVLMNQANKIQKIDPLWSIVEKQYELIKMCGEGMYGQVVKARSR